MKIEIRNLCKKFNSNLVLDHINLTLEEGKIYGFVGRNGSGKTMLFNAICGFITPTSGEIIVNDINITQKNIFPMDTRSLIENPKFIPTLSGYKNLELLASICNIISQKEINETLKNVDLFEEKDKEVVKYSLGMKQKLGIAQVLMENPSIMIFDEPFNGLDLESAEKIRKILQLERNKGKLILIATHIKEDVDKLCDEVYKLDNGKIVGNN